MDIKSALEPTGMAALPYNLAYAQVTIDKCLHWFDGDKDVGEVLYYQLIRDDWRPYLKQEEIRPREAGELWKNESGEWAHTDERFDYGPMKRKLFFIRRDSMSKVEDIKIVIHNQNGWQRIYPPVEDKETVVIEGVEFKNSDEGIVLWEASFPLNISSDILFNKPSMTMKLSWDKEK